MGDSHALLFAPTRPPVRLSEAGEVILGRSPSCELPLPSAEASRRHAAVLRHESGWVVRDLGSTNGTFVNGHRLEGEHRLRPGDRIEIGGVPVTFCEVDPALAELGGGSDHSMTIIANRPAAAPAALDGTLEEIPTFALLQMLEMGSKSGCLEIQADDGPVRIWLQNGRPVHAETGKQVGADAAIAIVQLERGRFRFEASPPPAETTIQAALTELLLEATRLADETDRERP